MLIRVEKMCLCRDAGCWNVPSLRLSFIYEGELVNEMKTRYHTRPYNSKEPWDWISQTFIKVKFLIGNVFLFETLITKHSLTLSWFSVFRKLFIKYGSVSVLTFEIIILITRIWISEKTRDTLLNKILKHFQAKICDFALH